MAFEDAVSADVYSYALVCFWILFQEKPVINPLRGGEASLLLKHAQTNTVTIEELKYADELRKIACKTVAEDDILNPLQKQGITKFFEQTLVKVDGAGFEHTIRETNFSTLLGFLVNDRFVYS